MILKILPEPKLLSLASLTSILSVGSVFLDQLLTIDIALLPIIFLIITIVLIHFFQFSRFESLYAIPGAPGIIFFLAGVLLVFEIYLFSLGTAGIYFQGFVLLLIGCAAFYFLVWKKRIFPRRLITIIVCSAITGLYITLNRTPLILYIGGTVWLLSEILPRINNQTSFSGYWKVPANVINILMWLLIIAGAWLTLYEQGISPILPTGSGFLFPPYEETPIYLENSALFQRLSLSLIIILGALQRFRQIGRKSRQYSFLWWGVTAVSAGLVFLAHPLLSHWTASSTFNAKLSGLLASSWILLTPILGIAIILWSNRSLSWQWKALTIGSTGGVLLTYLWLPFVYAVTYNLFVPGIKFIDGKLSASLQPALAIGLIVILLVGPVTATWGRPQNRSQAVMMTGLAGLVFSLFIFASLGAILGVVAGQSSIFGVAFSRAGFDEIGFPSAVGGAVLHIFPWVNGALLVCLALGTISALTGGLWPIHSITSGPDAQEDLLSGTTLVTIFFLFQILFLNFAIFDPLADRITNTLQVTGDTSWWKPEWTAPASIAIPGFVILIMTVAAIRKLATAPKSYPNAEFAFGYGTILLLAGLAPYFLFIARLSTSVAVMSTLVLGGTGIVFLREGRRLWVMPGNTRPAHQNLKRFTTSLAVHLPLLVLSSLPLMILGSGLALITINAINELSKIDAPPPGRDWLFLLIERTIYFIPLFSAWYWLSLGVIYTLMIGFFGSAFGNERVDSFWWSKIQILYTRFKEKSKGFKIHPVPILQGSYFRLFVFGLVFLLISYYGGVFISTILIYLFLKYNTARFQSLPWSIYILAGLGLLLGIILFIQGGNTIALTFLIGPAIAFLYRAVVVHNEGSRKIFSHFLFLGGLGTLIILLTGQSAAVITNGVAKFKDARWEIYGPQNSPLVGNRSYQIFKDSTGRLWLSGYYGPDGILESQEWIKLRFYTETSISQGQREHQLATPGVFLEKDGEYWFVSEMTLYKLITINDKFALKIPNRPLPTQDVNSDSSSQTGSKTYGADGKGCPTINLLLIDYSDANECPAIQSTITSVAIGNNGAVWVGTQDAGAILFTNTETLDNSDWRYFSTANSGIISNNVSSLMVDQLGNVWLLSSAGVSVYSPEDQWSTFKREEIGLRGTPQVIFQTSQSQIWLGTDREIAAWTGAAWQGYTLSPPASLLSFYEDRSGQLWALTTSGAYQYTNAVWSFFKDIPADPFWQNPFGIPLFYTLQPYETGIRVMAEDDHGNLWFGGPRGLLRYDRDTGITDYFYPSNSGLPSEDVKSLAPDDDGALWVSTYTIHSAQRSELPGIGFAFLFIGLVLGNIYQGYQLSPNHKASLIFKKVAGQPHRLLPEIYSACRGIDASHVLAILADQLKSDSGLAGIVKAYLDLVSPQDVHASLQKSTTHIFQALQENKNLPSTKELALLYQYFSTALQVKSVTDIGELSLRIFRSQDHQKIAFSFHDSAHVEFPDLVDRRTVDALEMMAKASSLLKKYLLVESAQDRLGYIADSFGSLERARRDANLASGPEQILLVAICDGWLQIINKELDLLSGHADLVVEFRTKQIRYSEQVTVVLAVKNIGSALADHIEIAILPEDQPGLTTRLQTSLDHLSAGEPKSVEFGLSIAQKGNLRISGEITWSDRIAANNRLEFADVIRFYETSEKFERIPNPYLVGHPVKSPELFRGREDVFEFIHQNLGGTTQSHTLVLYGQRRTGKTSILYQILNGRLGQGYLPVLVDVQELAPAINHMSDLFTELALLIHKTIKKTGRTPAPLDESGFHHAPTRAFSRFLDDVESQLSGAKLVLMFDEFELIEERIVQGRLAPETLGYLRSLMQHKDYLVFIFTGTHKLEQMSADYWSIFFNIALHLQVSFMKPEDATHLIREPVRRLLSIDDLVVEKIIVSTHGHPYFIQLICWALVNHCNKAERNYATLSDLNDVLRELIASGEAYFAFIWQLASPEERMVMAALADCARPGKAAVPVQEILQALARAGSTGRSRETIIRQLDGLVHQEILLSGGLDDLHYSFQIGLIGDWVKHSKPLRSQVERGA